MVHVFGDSNSVQFIKVLEVELRLEKMSKKQELQEREKEITEQRKELESVRKELEREKQKPPVPQEVAF